MPLPSIVANRPEARKWVKNAFSGISSAGLTSMAVVMTANVVTAHVVGNANKLTETQVVTTIH